MNVFNTLSDPWVKELEAVYLKPALTAVILHLLMCCANSSDKLYNWKTESDEKLIYLWLSYKVLSMIRGIGETLKSFANFRWYWEL